MSARGGGAPSGTAELAALLRRLRAAAAECDAAVARGAVRPVLVGELNPYGARLENALFPLPRRASGDRLCRVVLGLEPEDYLRRYRRVNLCVGAWSLPRAREAAGPLGFDAQVRDQCLVLLGAKVCAAFGVPYEPFTARPLELRRGATCPPGWDPTAGPRRVVLPHPSGLSRAWVVPGAVERARAAMREAGAL